MDEKVGKMSARMALREEVAKVARDDAIQGKKYSLGKAERGKSLSCTILNN